MDDKRKGLFRRLFGVKRYEPRPGPLAELDRPLIEKPGEMVPTDFLGPGYAFNRLMAKYGPDEGGRLFDMYSEKYGSQTQADIWQSDFSNQKNKMNSYNDYLVSEGQGLDGVGFTGQKKGLPLRNGKIDFEAISQFLMQQEQSDEMVDTARRTMIPGVDVFGTRKKVR